MYLMIDNYDSFVYNLKAYFEELGGDHPFPGTEASVGCGCVCGSSQEISGEDSDPRGLSWTPGAWILQRCVCPQGGASDAW